MLPERNDIFANAKAQCRFTSDLDTHTPSSVKAHT